MLKFIKQNRLIPIMMFSSLFVLTACGGDSSDSPFFFPPETDRPAESEVTITNNNAVASGVATVTLEAVIIGGSGFPVANETVTFVRPLGVEFSALTCVTGSDGKCSVTATSTVAGNYSAVVSTEAGELSNSPITLSFTAGMADSVTSSVTASVNGAVANGVATDTLEATILDATENPVSDETVTFVEPAGVLLSSTTCVTASTGKCSVTATSASAGDYFSTVSIVAGVLDNSPVAFSFTAGVANNATSTVATIVNGAIANGAATDILEVTVLDGTGNPLSNQTVNFVQPVGVSLSATSCISAADGKCRVTATSTSAGNYSSVVSISSGVLGNSPAAFNFVADVATSTTSTVTAIVNGATADDVDTDTLEATILDAFDNPVSGETVTFVQPADVSLSSLTCVTISTGKCSVTATSSTVGGYTSAVSIEAGDLNNSPVGFNFVVGAADNTRSLVTTTVNNATADGVDTDTLEATILDATDNPVTGETVSFVEPGGVSLSSLMCVTGSTGKCSVTATSTTAGGHISVVSITAGALSNTAFFNFVADVASDTTSTVTAIVNGAIADDLETDTLEATILDAFDNPVSGETVTFVEPAGVSLSATSCVTISTGKCSVTATSTVAGNYSSAVSITAGDLSDSPVNFNFVADAGDTVKSTVATIVNGAQANGVATDALEATILDAFDNPVNNATVEFVEPAGVSLSSITCVTAPTGKCSVTAWSNIAGDYSSVVSISAGELSNSPAQFYFFGAADATNSTVTASIDGAQANGAATDTLEATILDVNSHPVPDETVTFVEPADVNLSSTTCVTDSDGVCSVTATSIVEGNYSGAVSIGGVALSNSPVGFSFIAAVSGAAFPLNDTGAIGCGDYAYTDVGDYAVSGSGNHAYGLDCAVVNATVSVDGADADNDMVRAGQDVHYGRDVTFNDDTDGVAGFSFTKLDSNGIALVDQTQDYATVPWSCVLDNVTGLTWEVKTDDAGLQDKDNTYSWYNSAGANDGGLAGTENGGSCPGDTNCDTEKYVAAVNASNAGAGICGANDWRLPTQYELLSLVNNNHTFLSPSIDAAFFPNTLLNAYWLVTPNANDSTKAWNVEFFSGTMTAIGKSNAFLVRLVR